MKVKTIIGFLLFSLSVGSVYAQESEDYNRSEENNISQRLDSLQQANDKLATKVQSLEDEQHDQQIWSRRKKYFNIGYVKQTLTCKDLPGNPQLKSDFGVSLAFGRTFYLHKKPLFGMLKFGLDLTLPEITYVKYKESDVFYSSEETGTGNSYDYDDYEDEDINLGMHQVDIGAQIGPSITVNPIDHLKVSTYCHFAPAGSIIILDDEVNASFVPYVTFGGAVAYKAISIGVEGRWGTAKYNGLSVNDDYEDYDDFSGSDPSIDNFVDKSKTKFKTKSLTFYISFRF